MEYDEYGDRLDGFGVDEDTRPLTRFYQMIFFIALRKRFEHLCLKNGLLERS